MTTATASAKLTILDASNPRKISDRVNMLAEGKGGANYGTLTLTANAATTTVTDARIPSTGHLSLTPTTAHAAAELAGGNLYVSARAEGSFTLTHANNAQTDRSFTYGWQS